MVRFVNSGTEACLSALRVMRAFTGRTKIIKFEGCYHGHGDAFLVQAGSGVVTLGLPDSPGVPAAVTAPTLCAPYNDLKAVKALFAANKDEIAGVILEPVVGNSGFIVPDKAFLQGLRDLTKQHGALLCFDEVMTGFRISYGGAQKYWGITPDLTTMGKVIGGGLPVGAYGGRRDIMSVVAPAGPMYQAGTLSGNPLAMTAGIHTLRILRQPGSYEHLDRVTKRLVAGLLEEGRKAGHKVCGGSISGMFGLFFTEGPVKNFKDGPRRRACCTGRCWSTGCTWRPASTRPASPPSHTPTPMWTPPWRLPGRCSRRSERGRGVVPVRSSGRERPNNSTHSILFIVTNTASLLRLHTRSGMPLCL